jgi:hypothetical protein
MLPYPATEESINKVGFPTQTLEVPKFTIGRAITATDIVVSSLHPAVLVDVNVTLKFPSEVNTYELGTFLHQLQEDR